MVGEVHIKVICAAGKKKQKKKQHVFEAVNNETSELLTATENSFCGSWQV